MASAVRKLKNKYVDIPDVAVYLGLSETTIKRMILNEEIPYYKIGGRYKFDVNELDQWMKEKKVSNG